MLPSIEEGFGLVCTEAMGSGCVPLVSSACTDLCRHNENSLVHAVGDVKALTAHITMLHQDRALLKKLRQAGLDLVPAITWNAAGKKLLQVFNEIVASKRKDVTTTPAISARQSAVNGVKTKGLVSSIRG